MVVGILEAMVEMILQVVCEVVFWLRCRGLSRSVLAFRWMVEWSCRVIDGGASLGRGLASLEITLYITPTFHHFGSIDYHQAIMSLLIIDSNSPDRTMPPCYQTPMTAPPSRTRTKSCWWFPTGKALLLCVFYRSMQNHRQKCSYHHPFILKSHEIDITNPLHPIMMITFPNPILTPPHKLIHQNRLDFLRSTRDLGLHIHDCSSFLLGHL